MKKFTAEKLEAENLKEEDAKLNWFKLKLKNYTKIKKRSNKVVANAEM